jgi:hypothetical protein
LPEEYKSPSFERYGTNLLSTRDSNRRVKRLLAQTRKEVVITKSLPPTPSLKHLRLEAKNILKAHKAGDPSCGGVLRNLHQFKEQPDEEILKAKVGLQEVQFALAMEYGFKSWAEIKDALDIEAPAHRRRSNRIEGIPRLTWRDKDMPFAGAIESATAPTPSPLAFDEILSLTGFSMGFRWWEGVPGNEAKWCVSSMDIGYFPYVLEAITRGTGIGLTPLWYKGNMGEDEHEALFTRVMDSIDAGNAVLCSPFGNLGVILGYEEHNRTLYVNHYLASEPARMSLNQMNGPAYLIFLEPTRVPGYTDNITLNTAIREFASLTTRDPQPYGGGEYYFGASAWEKVRKSMSDLDAFSEDDQKNFLKTLDYTLHRVYDCRKAALCFLARYSQSIHCGMAGKQWNLEQATAIAGCLLKELDHFSKYTFYTDSIATIRKTAVALVESLSASDAELMRICCPDDS